VVNFIDIRTAAESEDDYDWTITCRSRIVGAAAPARASFSEFRSFNADERDERYSTPQGMYYPHCGLEKVWMTWTGPEYMYHMLKHNNALIPEEGLAMLRYFSLGDWHEHKEYAHLTNDDDADFQAFVTDFDQMRRDERRKCNNITDLSDEECNSLWEAYYGSVVAKYCGGDKLMW
jgi:inositol oxygenase